MNVLVVLCVVLVLVYLSVQWNYHLDWICDLELDLAVVFVHTYMCLLNPVTKNTGCIQLGTKNNRTLQLQTSIKSQTENKQWLPTADIKSNKVLEKNNFSSGKFLSKSSNLLLFLSHQIHHIEQWGTTFQTASLWWRPSFPCQQANRSTTVLGITQWIPNKMKTTDHNLVTIGQWNERWSTDYPLPLHK